MSPGPRSSPYLSGAVVDNPVALVTSLGERGPNVMTVSLFGESSHIPPLVRISIAPGSLTYQNIQEQGWFALSVLARGQEEWALGCGTASGRDGSKFERLGIRHRPGPRGLPLLPDCLTTSECRVVDRVELPGHVLIVGKLTASYRQARRAYLDALLISDLVRHLER